MSGLAELRISRTALGLNIALFAVVASTLMMTTIVAWVDGHWLLLIGSLVAMILVLAYAATDGYRLRSIGHAKVEVHSMFRVKRLDLSQGFDVREGWAGRKVVYVKAGPVRTRLHGGIGGSVVVSQWLAVAAQ